MPTVSLILQRRLCADCWGQRLRADCLLIIATAALRRLLGTAASCRLSLNKLQRRLCADCWGRRLRADCLFNIATAALRRLLGTAASCRLSLNYRNGGFAPTVGDGGFVPTVSLILQRRLCADCWGQRLRADCLLIIATAALRRLLGTAASCRLSLNKLQRRLCADCWGRRLRADCPVKRRLLADCFLSRRPLRRLWDNFRRRGRLSVSTCLRQDWVEKAHFDGFSVDVLFCKFPFFVALSWMGSNWPCCKWRLKVS